MSRTADGKIHFPGANGDKHYVAISSLCCTKVSATTVCEHTLYKSTICVVICTVNHVPESLETGLENVVIATSLLDVL